MLSAISLWVFLSIVALALYFKWRAKKTFIKYLKFKTSSGITAKQMANHHISKIAVGEVRLKEVDRRLNDYYDPAEKSLNLSYPNSQSLTALGMTAHELGHLLQHVNEPRLLNLRSKIVFVSNFLSQVAFPIFLGGFALRRGWLMRGGLIVYCLAVISSLLTLPVEVDASKKAFKILKKGSFIDDQEETVGTKKVLFAACLTYIASPGLAFLHPFKKLINWQK